MFELTPIETACGVTEVDVRKTASQTLVHGAKVIPPKHAGPALGAAVARFLLGVPASYSGMNSLGYAVYSATA